MASSISLRHTQSGKCSADTSGTMRGDKHLRGVRSLCPAAPPTTHPTASACRWETTSTTDPILNECIISTKRQFSREHFLGRVPDCNLSGTSSQHGAHGEGTHLNCKSPVPALSTAADPLSIQLDESSAAQVLVPKQPEDVILQKHCSSPRTAPSLPTPEEEKRPLSTVQVLLATSLFLHLLLYRRRNIYPEMKSMDSFGGAEEKELRDLGSISCSAADILEFLKPQFHQ